MKLSFKLIHEFANIISMMQSIMKKLNEESQFAFN